MSRGLAWASATTGAQVRQGRGWPHDQGGSLPDGLADPGWAERTVDESLQTGVVGGIAVWQLVVLCALTVSAISVPTHVLVLAHLALGGLAATLAIRRMRVWPALTAFCALTMLDLYAVVDVHSALAYVTIWGAVLSVASPFIVVPVRSAVPLALLSLATTSAGMLAWHPDWGTKLLITTDARGVILAVCTWLAMVGVHRVTDDVAEREIEFAADYRELMVGRLAARTAAEDARMLHDTVVNTLSSVAVGGAFAADVALVRQQCADDVRAVEAELGGPDRPAVSAPMFAGTRPDIEVRWTGAIDDAERCAAQLSPRAGRALRGALGELIRNAAKHSGAGWVAVDVGVTRSAMTVTVSDHGRGFDGRLIPGRGIAESVVARSTEAGFDVAIRTAPDQGTVAVLTIDLEGQPAVLDEPAEPDRGATAGVDRIRRSTRWFFSASIVAFGLASTGIGRPVWPAREYLVVVVAAALTFALWALSRDGRRPSSWVTTLVSLVIPAAFLFEVTGVDFASADVINWTAVSLTPVLVALVIVGSRESLLLAIGLEVGAAAAATYVVAQGASHAAAIVLIALAAQLGQFMAAMMIDPVIVDVGTRHELHQRVSLRARSERMATEMAAQVRADMTSAGLNEALDVLRSIGAGEADPTDPQVRSRCATAEHELRQIISLSVQAPRINRWLSLALTSARSKQVTLTLQGCTEDAPDLAAAKVLGSTIMGAVDAASPGSDLRVSLFPRRDHALSLLVVGPTDTLNSVEPGPLPPGYSFARQSVEGLTLLELVTATPGGAGPIDADDAASTSPVLCDPA